MEQNEQKQVTIDEVVDFMISTLMDLKKSYKGLTAYAKSLEETVKKLQSEEVVNPITPAE